MLQRCPLIYGLYYNRYNPKNSVNSEGNREHYIGRIDEVAIWSVALDEGEIQKAMDQVFAVEPANKLPTKWGAIKGGYLRTPKSFTSRGVSW